MVAVTLIPRIPLVNNKPDKWVRLSSFIRLKITVPTITFNPMYNMIRIRKNDASPQWGLPHQLIKPRHNLKLIARQMEARDCGGGEHYWLVRSVSAISSSLAQFVIKIIYVMAEPYYSIINLRGKIPISNIYSAHWFWSYSVQDTRIFTYLTNY